MRVPIEWLREYAPAPDNDPRAIADALIGAGLEVESVDIVGEGTSGPVLVGRVNEIEELTDFKKPIRYCQVDVGQEIRGIVCGATNFAVGDLVVVALPGAQLPGGFEISARKTYGHVSDGMICSARELGLGDDHDGILVLESGTPGEPAGPLLGLGDAVLDIAVTPDRGYCLSMRGVARETATALDCPFSDPAEQLQPVTPSAGGVGVEVLDTNACPQYIAVTLNGFNPEAASPAWLTRRLVTSGMRPISLAVDVTNYVMLELGQPLHAFDAATLTGDIAVRRATAGETLITLDHVERRLDPDDLLIADAAGPIGLAGTMGGLHTEISPATEQIVLEAAAFAPTVVARMARRHRLPSEASRRFERGVDAAMPAVAAAVAIELLQRFGGGDVTGVTVIGSPTKPASIALAPDLPSRIAGTAIGAEEVRTSLHKVGAAVDDSAGLWLVQPPSWRPDLRDPADLVEEVVRLHGYQNLPTTLPSPPAGRGLTKNQRQRRAVSRALAHAGFIETLCYPFLGADEVAALGVDDDRTAGLRLANPLSDEADLLRTTLLPGLITAMRRNLSRGAENVALFETGLVFLPTSAVSPVRPGVAGPPTDAELTALEAMLPTQPNHIAAVVTGTPQRRGYDDEPLAPWRLVIRAARTVAAALSVPLSVEPDATHMPWHPGRCARLLVDGEVVGYAGELHPRVIAAAELPARTAAMELDLDALLVHAEEVVPAPAVWNFPVAKEDVALIVAEDVAAAQVAASLRVGGGELLESVRFFDEYRGSQLPEGTKSLAFALRFRAPDRTLSVAEVTAARQAAVAEAAQRYDAVLRSG
jgi:phenylalanyl-tRNA synthetase beta chain